MTNPYGNSAVTLRNLSRELTETQSWAYGNSAVKPYVNSTVSQSNLNRAATAEVPSKVSYKYTHQHPHLKGHDSRSVIAEHVHILLRGCRRAGSEATSLRSRSRKENQKVCNGE